MSLFRRLSVAALIMSGSLAAQAMVDPALVGVWTGYLGAKGEVRFALEVRRDEIVTLKESSLGGGSDCIGKIMAALPTQLYLKLVCSSHLGVQYLDYPLTFLSSISHHDPVVVKVGELEGKMKFQP